MRIEYRYSSLSIWQYSTVRSFLCFSSNPCDSTALGCGCHEDGNVEPVRWRNDTCAMSLHRACVPTPKPEEEVWRRTSSAVSHTSRRAPRMNSVPGPVLFRTSAQNHFCQSVLVRPHLPTMHPTSRVAKNRNAQILIFFHPLCVFQIVTTQQHVHIHGNIYSRVAMSHSVSYRLPAKQKITSWNDHLFPAKMT